MLFLDIFRIFSWLLFFKGKIVSWCKCLELITFNSLCIYLGKSTVGLCFCQTWEVFCYYFFKYSFSPSIFPLFLGFQLTNGPFVLSVTGPCSSVLFFFFFLPFLVYFLSVVQNGWSLFLCLQFTDFYPLLSPLLPFIFHISNFHLSFL